jgi:hypothetical protein
MSEQRRTTGWLASPGGRLAQSIGGALFLGWISEASTAEMLLMFMVLRLQLDNYYE